MDEFTHNNVGDALTLVIIGTAFTVTAVVVTDIALVQPVPGYVTVRL